MNQLTVVLISSVMTVINIVTDKRGEGREHLINVLGSGKGLSADVFSIDKLTKTETY